MALNFPNNPLVGDVYEDSASGFSYQWDGTFWKSYRVEISDSLGGNLDADLILNSNDITGTGNINITGVVTATSFDGGTATFSGDVGIGSDSPQTKLDIQGGEVYYHSGTGNNLGIKLTYSNGNSTGILDTYGNHALEIRTNNTERLRIDSSGNVGIGNTDPGALLHVASSSNAGVVRIGGNNAGQTGIDISYSGSGPTTTTIKQNYRSVNGSATLDIDTGTFTVSTGTSGSESARIDSDGRLLVGTSASRGNTLGTPKSQIEGAGDNFDSSLSIISNSANGYGPSLVFGSSKGTSVGSATTLTAASSSIGRIDFCGADGTSLLPGSRIEALTDATPGANDMPGRLVFSTTAAAASSPTERMRIKSDGAICAGTTATNWFSQAQKVVFRYAGSGACQMNLHDVGGEYPFEAWNSGSSGTRGLIKFRVGGSGNVVGSITTDGSTVTYGGSSDYRLKENVIDLDGAITRVKQLQPKRFNFISTPDKTIDGFLAHEAQTVVPEAVTGTHNEVDEDGNPVYQGIDQSKLVPLLTAALQEAIAKIETLEAKVASLENG